MEAKLKIADFDCYNKSFSCEQRKEECRDAVVPDTQPDIVEVLHCGGALLIRSKDVSAGRLCVEANIPATVLYRGENGAVCTVEVNVPVFLSAEDESIGDASHAAASLKLLSLEARVLNPRKVMVRAEIASEMSCYEKGKFSYTEGLESGGHIHCHEMTQEISLVTTVTEKTFALTDEISVPPAADGAKGVIYAGCESVVDEVKCVGSKFIIKGRLKSRLLLVNGDGELCHLEPSTDFSQIIDGGTAAAEGLCSVFLVPSGTYCHISPENEGRIGMEFNMVAQLVCHGDKKICCIDDAYSNSYAVECEYSDITGQRLLSLGSYRESLRQLFETVRPVTEVLYSTASIGKAVFDKGRMLLPVTLSAICSGADGTWCERRRTELCFRLPASSGELFLKSAEINSCDVLPVPGGIEFRLDASAEICARISVSLRCLSSLSYDESCPLDNSDKPSLTLLRAGSGDDLWQLARENCSSVEAIVSVNGLEEAGEEWRKLILIPKTC